MKTLKFCSCFEDKMRRFVELKRLSGTDYQDQIKQLGYFDKFLVTRNFNEPYPTHDILQKYLTSIAHLHSKSIYNRFGVVRLFCRYLSQFEPSCYIPEPARTIVKPEPSRIPYIYTKAEIKDLLDNAAKLSPQKPLYCYTYYTLFGLLYTTGIRIGEALALNIEDFHQDSKLLHIREGKFHKARWVPISDSTDVILKKYINIRQQTNKIVIDSPFFIDRTCKRLSYRKVNYTFHILLKRCNIHISKDYVPRIHDIRHAFAIHRIIKWYRDGENVNVLLPALATYMGHVDITSSQVYLQATPEMLEQGNQRFLKYFRENIKNNGGCYE